MSITLKLSPLAFDALEKLCSGRDFAPLYKVIPKEQAAWLYFLLQAIPDDEDVFPKGKWATIQHLQSLLIEAAIAQAREAK